MSGILASFSELDSFRQCPLKHQAAYKERWTAPTKSPALIKGTDLHKVLEVHYNVLQGWQETGEVPSMVVLEPAIKGALATCDPEHRDLVEWMYTGYLEMYGFEQEWGWKILAVERSYQVPLPHPDDKRSSIRLKLKIDIVVKDPMGRIWVVDNKSGRNLPKDKELDIDDQFGLYVWAMRTMGKNVFGAVHNAVRSEKLVRPMTMEERFKRTRLHRTDGELDVLAREAYKTLETAWRHYRPGQGDAPRAPDSDRCFPGDTLAAPIGNLQAVSRRWYRGDLMAIQMAGGHELAGTPNHPVMTDKGWVPLHGLRQGDSVMGGGGLDHRPSRMEPDVQHRPAPLAQIFDTFQGIQRRIAGPAVNLYGERPDHDVDVITADSDLASMCGVCGGEPADEEILSRSYLEAALASGFPQPGSGLHVLIRPPESRQSPSAEGPALLWSPSGGSEPVGFGLGTASDARPGQVTVHGPAANAESPREGQHRFPGYESPYEVLDVSVRQFEGHVYDLQTSSGAFAAQSTIAAPSVVARNCKWRCDYTEACLLSRKQGRSMSEVMVQFGFKQDFRRH